MKEIAIRMFAQTSEQFGNEIDGAVGTGMHFMCNNWTISAQAGWGHYCSNDPTRSHERLTSETVRTDCEIAIWRGEESLIQLGNTCVDGWIPWSVVIELVFWLANQEDSPSKKEIRIKFFELKRKSLK